MTLPVETLKSVPRGKAVWNANGEFVSVLLTHLFVFFVRSTISRQPAGRFTPKFACGRILVPDVSSPLLGVSGPGGRKRGKYFRYYRSQCGIFVYWWFLSDISVTRGRIHTKLYLLRDNVS